MFSVHFIGSLAQLFFHSWTSNEIIQQSSNIANAVYETNWYLLLYKGLGNVLTKDLMFIMMRAGKPCELTAGGFATMSLETFMRVSKVKKEKWSINNFAIRVDTEHVHVLFHRITTNERRVIRHIIKSIDANDY